MMLILTEDKEATLLRHLCNGMSRKYAVWKSLPKIKVLWGDFDEAKKKN